MSRLVPLVLTCCHQIQSMSFGGRDPVRPPLLNGAARGSHPLLSLQYEINDEPSCRRFDKHCTCLACSRAFPKAGRRIEISSAIIPITTSNSTKVNAGVNARRHAEFPLFMV